MGPLKGLRVIEFAGIGPVPFCAMLLADMGAEVIRIDRTQQGPLGDIPNVTNRGRKSIALDLKNPESVEVALRLVEGADALLEGLRPGVMERLGLGPDVCLERNPKLVYGRMTGWGQDGPLAQAAGHDLNYIAITGALHAMGRAGEPPAPPINLIGDFGGGAMFLAFGIMSGVFEAQRSGKGQVVDAAMSDGAAVLMTMMYGLKSAGMWTNTRQDNFLDGAAHFYDTYTCADDKFVAIGSVEPQFYSLLLELTGITDSEFDAQWDKSKWPELKTRLAEVIRTKTRDEWCALMEGTDVCFAPVLDMDEAPEYPHNQHRKTFIDIDGVTQPAPAPRFSRTSPDVPTPPEKAGASGREVLLGSGFTAEEIEALVAGGAVAGG